MTTVKAVARKLIDLAHAKNIPVTNLKLQKLLYFAHGLMLVRHEAKLIDTESFQAWKYGPVLADLYHDMKIFGQSNIKPTDGFIPFWPELDGDMKHEKTEVLNAVLDQLGSMSGGRLIDISHDTNGPWHGVYISNKKNIDIDNDAIKDYFKTIVKQ